MTKAPASLAGTARTSAAPADQRLPQSTRVGGVRLQVTDLQRSLAFYREVLGLRVIEVSDDQARLAAPDANEPLVTLRAAHGTVARTRGAFGLFHFAILVPERATLGRFVAHLASRGVRAGMSDHGVSEAIYLSDPDGLGIEVYADRARASWQHADEQLVMTTEPLDVGNLVTAAGGAPWEGMPAGTTMGHVHLHVGDLGDAAAFYRGAVGFDLTVWNYPGALFFSAGGYHHHLGTNVWAPGPAPASNEARLLEWTLVVPSAADADAIGHRLLRAGRATAADGRGWTVADPWGTTLRIAASD